MSSGVLGLDLATHTGWAWSKGTSVDASGNWNLSPKKNEESGARLVKFWDNLEQLRSSFSFNLVVYELALHMHGKHQKRAGAHVQAEIQGTLKLWCERRGISYLGLSPTSVKRHATGKGNADKEMMVTAARRKWRKPFESDDEADSCWVLDAYLNGIRS